MVEMFPLKIMLRGFPGGPVVKTALSMQRTQVRSLVGELRSHMPHGQKKKKKKKIPEENLKHQE